MVRSRALRLAWLLGGWATLLITSSLALATIHELYFPVGRGIAYQPKLFQLAVALCPILLTLIPFGAWGALTVLSDPDARTGEVSAEPK